MRSELVQGASHEFDAAAYLAGEQTPVFFGSAINNFGVTPLLDSFVEFTRPRRGRAKRLDARLPRTSRN